MSEDYTHDSPMPFGRYKGRALGRVPASNLLWAFDHGINSESQSKLIKYIKKYKKELSVEDTEKDGWLWSEETKGDL